MHSIELCKEVVAAAEEIHLALGPTLFRETYTVCLAMELSNRGFQVQTRRARLTPGAVDHLFINNLLRVDIDADRSTQPLDDAIKVQKGSMRPINLYLNFGTTKLLDERTKESLFNQIISIADVSPFPPSEHLQ